MVAEFLEDSVASSLVENTAVTENIQADVRRVTIQKTELYTVCIAGLSQKLRLRNANQLINTISYFMIVLLTQYPQ